MHNRKVLWLIIVIILLLAGTLASRTEKLTEEVWTVELVADCALDCYTSDGQVARVRTWSQIGSWVSA